MSCVFFKNFLAARYCSSKYYVGIYVISRTDSRSERAGSRAAQGKGERKKKSMHTRSRDVPSVWVGSAMRDCECEHVFVDGFKTLVMPDTLIAKVRMYIEH